MWSWGDCRRPGAAEADVAHAGVDHLRAAGGRPVAQAVRVGAEVRPALDHLARDPELRLGRVEARLAVTAARVGRHAARSLGVGRVALVHQSAVHSQTLPAMSWSPKPLGGNDPTGASARNPDSPVDRHGKSGPSHVLAMIRPSGRASSPHVKSAAVEPAAGGELPLRLGRQPTADPGRVGGGVLVGDVDDRVVERARRARIPAPPAPPGGAGRPRPPLAEVAQVDRTGRRCEHHRTGHEVLRRARPGSRPGRADVRPPSCSRWRPRTRRTRAFVTAYRSMRERVDPHAVGGRLLGVVAIGAHRELAAVELDADVARRSCGDPRSRASASNTTRSWRQSRSTNEAARRARARPRCAPRRSSGRSRAPAPVDEQHEVGVGVGPVDQRRRGAGREPLLDGDGGRHRHGHPPRRRRRR